ncbi:MAG: MBL fold metallo-hydrolase [Candidatus Thorarchaeota archaeon]|nr:MBL fold metallo-hydrolase [Candidatus Thorarchaeota archaeon]
MQLIEGIHQIEVPTPFPVGAVNCYLLEGSPLTLIDTGVKSSLAIGTLESGLSEAGYSIEDIEQICLTHGHVDHIGLARTIMNRSDRSMNVWIHQMDSERLIDYEGYIDDRMRAYHRIATESGAPIQEGILDSQPALARYFLKLGESVEEVRFAEDKGMIETGLGALTVEWAPGHSLGSVCYALDSKKVLFSGDHVLGDISSNPSLDFDGILGISLLKYFESLEKIRKYSGYSVYPGHRNVIGDLAARIDDLLADYERKFNQTEEHLGDVPTTIYDLSRKLYGEYDSGQLILALAETQDLVRVLESRGQAKLLTHNGILCACK